MQNLKKFLIPWSILTVLTCHIAARLQASEVKTDMATPASKLELVKAKWLAIANNMVGTEKIKFLASYGLTEKDVISDAKDIDQLITSHDQLAEEYIHHSSQADPTGIIDNMRLQEIANEIFVGKVCDHVKILHDATLDISGIGVLKHHASNSCYITINKTAQLTNLPSLTATLYHERSHIVHADTLNKELLQCTAWINSHDEQTEVQTKSNAYCQAFETRADIYAAINLPDHGGSLIDFFTTIESTDTDEAITHPKFSDRIRLLATVKAELDAAASADASIRK